ncbi:winged helix-turn-helix domain-containing protein [Streptomyces sp. APSN-46.1]|uniref:winged helix-turn-helix domain-containing protein n=1 Tax=Streptomyces sp. APSN-46.1 TaxID=2929049 RepID=UPI001FB44C8B|nr:winged helix-turn-helix domain-containing protein [Streptomyces sp. APSN-46.1]MCJ1677667.1 winged helix-turn-helix domain-containing protein [Streptomyces sp. APSN-46.1]
MANTRSLASAASAATAPLTFPPSPRHRLRAVDGDEVARVVDLLPPGATWLPAPPHSLPTLPGNPPMVGYLVLVPADQQARWTGGPARAPRAVAAHPAPEAPSAASSVTDDGSLVRIDTARRTAEVEGQVLDLTYLEFELLAHLVAHPHRVHSRDQLVTTVWGYGHVGDGRTVDVHIARLRRKLGAAHRDAIQTVRRVGYKYAP